MKIFSKERIAKMLFIIGVLYSSLLESQKKNVENGFYFLADKAENGMLIYDNNSAQQFAVERFPVISLSDFKSFKQTKKHVEPIQVEEILAKLNDCGKAKWKNALKRIADSKESLFFVFDQQVILEQDIIGATNLSKVDMEIVANPELLERISKAIFAVERDCR